ncbi:acyl carrier protein [Mumia sp. zg.B21]|uniref:phosphopantetheine-binding protein n=1 Tax=Mumia sp. zg.B21 TaxID=2855447 RepID=UPI001C6E45E1|nr:phosphopantetheine-binding protein [Mumia sp. zg.B21]MBW9209509.1 acyl carrier protein [Mumia sp. zg.B21]
MTRLDRSAVRSLMADVLTEQGKELPANEAVPLRDIGFRSLDFSELALRVEDAIDEELNFEAAELRRIETVAHVLDLMLELQDA